MLDHGQLSPPTPVGSRRPSTNDVKSRRPSMPDRFGSDLGKLSMSRGGFSKGSFSDTTPRLLGSDGLAGFGRGISESLSRSALGVEEGSETEKEMKPVSPGVSGLAHPNNISAQLYTNPKLASLRTTDLSPCTTPSPTLATTPPILVDPQCSGYFVEAVRPCDPAS